jgi:hypothetical protein
MLKMRLRLKVRLMFRLRLRMMLKLRLKVRLRLIVRVCSVIYLIYFAHTYPMYAVWRINYPCNGFFT